jgi:hypothetical protein
MRCNNSVDYSSDGGAVSAIRWVFRASVVLMMMIIHYSHATWLDHGEIMYSPILFAVRPDLGQSAGGSRQLPLPPPGLSLDCRQKKERKERRKPSQFPTVTPFTVPFHHPSPNSSVTLPLPAHLPSVPSASPPLWSRGSRGSAAGTAHPQTDPGS